MEQPRTAVPVDLPEIGMYAGGCMAVSDDILADAAAADALADAAATTTMALTGTSPCCKSDLQRNRGSVRSVLISSPDGGLSLGSTGDCLDGLRMSSL